MVDGGERSQGRGAIPEDVAPLGMARPDAARCRRRSEDWVTDFIARVMLVRAKIAERGWRWFWLRLSEHLVHPRSPLAALARPLLRRLAARRGSRSMSGTLFLFYDLQVAPLTFNFIETLAAAEMTRRRLGLADIYVAVVPGRNDGLRWEDADYAAVVDRANRQWRLHNIVVAAAPLLPSCRGYMLCASREQAAELARGWARHVFPAGYSVAFPVPLMIREVMDRARAGERVFPCLATPREAMRLMRRRLEALAQGRRAVVITLRGYGYMPQRNAKIEAWAEFARALDPERYVPVFVRDTERTPDPLPEALRDFAVIPEVALNLQLRMALFECAWLNMALMHGPMELCWFNERCRYLIFQSVDSAPQTSREAIAREGYELGGQLPWALPLQRWVWEPDDLEVLQRCFREMERVIEGEEAQALQLDRPAP
jgi:hypothetical protein